MKVKVEIEISDNYCYSEKEECPMLCLNSNYCHLFKKDLKIDDNDNFLKCEECNKLSGE